jgi:hypothetical protein
MSTEAANSAVVSPECPSEAEQPKKGKPCGKPGRSGPPDNANGQTHGLDTLKRAVSTLGSRVVDKRSKVGKALAAWRADLIADLGGADSISTQEAALVDAAVKTKLILDSIDAWLLKQPTLVNKRSRSVIAAVQQRNSLVATLRGLLESLGLQRRAKPLPSLAEILASGEPSPCTQTSQSSELASRPEEPAAASTEGTS